MARADTQYVCQSCGAVHAKWAGRCEACEEWNTLAEESAPQPVPKGLRAGVAKQLELVGLAGKTSGPARLSTAIAELDRVLGGGLVAGSTVLIGGDPGIGKSTLVLQAAAALASAGAEVAYVSGEESIDQIRLRAARLGVTRRPGAAERGDLGARHPRHVRSGGRAAAPGDRLDPDDVRRQRRGGARHGDPAAHQRARADPLRQAPRHLPCS